jgi:hypothetical protein
MPLPIGLSPVDAGRLGLWLLGKRNHRAAARRRVHPSRAYPDTLVGRWCSICAPWKAQEYPGPRRLLAALCGVSPLYARRWIGGKVPLPAQNALRLADYLETRVERAQALIRDLREHARNREREVRASQAVAARRLAAPAPGARVVVRRTGREKPRKKSPSYPV